MAVEVRPLTYQDYLEMPDDGNKYEIVHGKLYVSPPPRVRHQDVSMNLSLLIGPVVKSRDLGKLLSAPCAVRLSRDEVVEPDLIFVRKERSDIIGELNIDGAPDLLIEILSPNKPQYDRVTKFNRYAEAGVAEYWIVDPEADTVEQFTLQEGGYARLEPTDPGAIESRVIEGLRLEASDVFRP